jgi:hypothetical protein
MLFHYLVNALREIKKITISYIKEDSIRSKINFDDILNKCISQNTHITGVAGTGKSTFIAKLTHKLYEEKNPYLMCANSLTDLSMHFQKHNPNDNILIFGLDRNQTHTIDINYLFSSEKFLNFVCNSELGKQNIKSNNTQKWFDFFNDENNALLFKDGYFEHIRDLIDNGYIDYYGDLNAEFSSSPISAYILLDYFPKFSITTKEKDQYIFLLNIIQLTLSQDKVNVIFDEERIFFNGLQNNYLKTVSIPDLDNNYIFSSQLLSKLLDDVQIVGFISFRLEDLLNEKIQNKYTQIDLNIKNLRPREFLFFDSELNVLTEKPIVVPMCNLEERIQWEVYLNNKQKKLHNKLQLDLGIKHEVREKKVKI